MATRNWGFDTRDMDTKVRAQDDFFRHVHGGWLERTKIPENEARWGSFTILRVETEKRLKKIVDSLSNGRYSSGTPEQMIRDFYRAGIDEARREKLGKKPIAPWLAKIDALSSESEMVDLLAELEVAGLGGIWGLLIDQDSKDSSRYLLHIAQSGLGMPDRDYYLKDDTESKRVREAYERHIEKLLGLLGDPATRAQEARKTIMRIETTLAEASMTKEDARDSEKIYHKFTLSTLTRLAPGIDWRRYMKAIGASKAEDVIVMQPEFLASVAKMITGGIPLGDWKTYLRFHLANAAAGALSKRFLKQNFVFYGTVLSGNKKMKPVWRRALAATNSGLGELLGKLYVKEYFPAAAKRRMNELVDDLFAAYAVRIKKLDWMTPATKKKALVKLGQMNRKIGYPDKWRSYRGLVVRADDYFGNLIRSNEFEHRRDMRKLGKPIDRTEWGMYPQTVNAYCNFNMNEIVFPAAILQFPFFDLRSDDALNYGSIGSVIGHEITHAFDDQGSKFDGKGNMKSWWTPEDRKRFDRKASVVKKQFDQYRVADGVPVNGQLTLGENIADLGGASIAYDAYQRELKRTGRKDMDGFTPEQRFFIGFSLFDCEKMRPEAEKTRVLTDPHSPSQFRINGPVSNLPEFYAAFGVKKGDKLYRSPKDRAKIW